MSAINLRPAYPKDCHAIGALQVACWQQRLAQYVPKEFVDTFNSDKQAASYRARILDPDYVVGVAVTRHGIVGFGALRPNTHPPADFTHEISALLRVSRP